MFRIFKITAILEGCSYLILLANMLFIKPNLIDLYKTLLYPIGMSHGVLFVGYCLLALLLKKSQNWSFSTFSLIILGSLIPFGTFYIEKKYLRNE
ncbi:DUF3817 domain-containing protein [Flavobacterium sp. TSSA_36]|jgi:integral membrane protein|uniref:DUF3817 domain-containing protein n=1 Tax=Flavobacterium sp. TSSA_36 TaxID=3447669 RepID=UPI003F338A95